jgi:hypothetical protein
VSGLISGISMRGYVPWARYNRVENPRGVFVADSRVFHKGGATEVLVAFFLEEEKDGSFTLRVHGGGMGGTGYETYRFDHDFVEDILSRPVRTDEDSPFGGKKYAYFALCMGGGGHKEWTTTMETMHDVVNLFKQVLN